MDSSLATTLSTRFGRLMIVLMQQVGGIFLRDRSALPAVLMAQERVRGLSMRLQSLLRRIEAGTLPASRPSRPGRERRPPERRPQERRPETVPGALRLPRRFGWLARDRGVAGAGIWEAAWQIGIALNEPATLEMLARAPRQAGRIVRPLCHAIWLEVPDLLRLPPRPKREPKPRAVKPAKRKDPPRPRRVASADSPRNVVGPGETMPLRSRARRRSG